MGARGRDVFDDGVEERLHRAADVFEVGLGVAVAGAGVDHREIHLLIGRVQRDEQLPHRVEDLMRIGILAVAHVDDEARRPPGTSCCGDGGLEPGLHAVEVRGRQQPALRELLRRLRNLAQGIIACDVESGIGDGEL